MERRSIFRCPVCSGPTIQDQNLPDGLRCKNSACRHNHQHIKCPRCQAQEISNVAWAQNTWTYTCGDCENTWSKSDAD